MLNKIITLLILCAFALTIKASELDDLLADLSIPEAPKKLSADKFRLRMPKITQPPEGAEEVTETYPNGSPLLHGFVKKDRKVGYWHLFYPNSQLKAEGEMKDDQRYGLWIYYSQNGKRSSDGEFDEKGQPSGEWRRYHPDGSISGSGAYVNGKEEGLWTRYDTNGCLVATTYYKAGRMEGPCYMYASDGSVISKGGYTRGERSGTWELHDPENGSAMKGEMKGGARVGVWTMKDSKNKKIITFNYNDKGLLQNAVTNDWE